MQGRTRRSTIGTDDGLETVRVNGDTNGDSAANEHNTNGVLDEPPRKKRRTFDVTLSHRETSPPWKFASADGPTSFVENGRRKSSRTNALPIELLPPSTKRHTRAGLAKREPPTRRGYADKTRRTLQDVKHGSSRSNERTPKGKPERRTISGKTIGDSKPKPSRTSSRLSGAPPKPPAKPPRAHGRGTRSPTLERHKRKESMDTGRRRSSRVARTPEPVQNGWHSESEIDGESDLDLSDIPFDENMKMPLLKLKVKAPKQTITHPEHVVMGKKFATFEEWLQHDDPLAGEGSRMTEEDARKEAKLRLKLINAGQEGGPLSEGQCSLLAPEPQEEPPQQYAQWDHLVTHAVRFKTLMSNERRHHMQTAKRIAHAAAARWRELQPKTKEEIEAQKREEYRQYYKLMLKKEFVTVWKTILDEVDRRRLARWEEEKEMLTKEALNAMLEQSKELHARRIRGEDSDMTDSASDESDADDEDDNMSSDSEEEPIDDGDEGLTVEQLRAKYAAISEEPSHYSAIDTDDVIGMDETRVEFETDAEASVKNETEMDEVALDEVDDMLLDDSDDSTDMSNDMGSSDEGEMTDESDEPELGLLGFFGRSDKIREETEEAGSVDLASEIDRSELGDELTADPVPEQILQEVEVIEPIVEDAEAPEQTVQAIEVLEEEPKETLKQEFGQVLELAPESVDLVDAKSSPEIVEVVMEENALPTHDQALIVSRVSASPGTNATKQSEVDSMSIDHDSPATTPLVNEPKIAVPFLLRGTLREYQHEGLDWLASQFAHRQNGILADEMGLGKTIQSIALLAHLACEHEIWGPHLIVVPTSVMLNWEMEFKKWAPGFKILTYYGTQEERKQKRRGWMDDNLWNVCITSYQLVLQDQQTFKRRNWQYLILDEAHNIKNFRSQRWQTLLNFKTRARLLLTGTPLQNNLSELWSLLYFLMPNEDDESGISQFAGLREFLHMFRKPVEEILEHGRDTLGQEAQAVVSNLHTLLRPFLLRRLKADVEKQMPAKYEHVVSCRLSKRQRFLYDGFMARASTKDALRSGNYLSVMSCLIQLRKVCNHPDLFETRPIVTSFAMDRSAIADYEIKEMLVRRRLLRETDDRANLDFLNLVPAAYEHVAADDAIHSHQLSAIRPLRELFRLQNGRIDFQRGFDGSSLENVYESLENRARRQISNEINHFVYQNALRIQRRPIYGKGTRDLVTLSPLDIAPSPPSNPKQLLEWMSNSSSLVRGLVPSLEQRAEALKPTIQKFACLTPAVITPDMINIALPSQQRALIQEARTTYYEDNFHEPRMCLSIAFPDKRLLQYDCGKLQRLDKLLRQLQAGGHRALIFTQMTKVLDILEQFLNIHGHRYLRLDGSTKVEQRQILTDRFNHDTRILAFILSSRSGGLGINLTGADTVIFYDLDWNPAMDKQCQDRCHRIGQTRDVHIYRFVSEYTIESNILRKANQKQLLDDVIIQEGEFTTDYFNRLSIRDMLGDEAVAALEADGDELDRTIAQEGDALAQVEDQEDTAAAKAAEREAIATDDADFEEKPATSGPVDPLLKRKQLQAARNAGQEVDDFDRGESVGMYMLRFLDWALKDVPLAPPLEKAKKKKRLAEGGLGGM